MPSPEKLPLARQVHRLLSESAVYRARVQYVADVLFGGNLKQLAAATNVNYRHLYLCVKFKKTITVRMLAQIAAHTNVQAEWLLLGIGPMVLGPEQLPASLPITFPATLASSFPVFDTLTVPAVAKPCKRRANKVPSNDAHTAGTAIYRARLAGKPACFFLGVDGVAACGTKVVRDFMLTDHVTSLAVTLSAVTAAAPDVDLTAVAKFAAAHGIGYGEAIGRWADDYLMHTCFYARKPLTVQAEIGEIAAHTAPSAHGAELGAAVGAAAYVDLLVMAEQLRQACLPPGGVLVVLGEPHRALRLLHKAVRTLQSCMPDNAAGGTVVVLGAQQHSKELLASVPSGWQTVFIDGTYSDAFCKLVSACDAAYIGK
jgi:hypothetical protein